MDCYKELILFFILALIAFLIGRKLSFFTLPHLPSDKKISLSQVLIAFALFFGLTALITTLTPPLPYFALLSFFLSFVALIIYSCLKRQKKIWGTLSQKAYLYGLFSWALALPIAAFFGKIAACFMASVYGFTDPQQYIAERILSLKPYPLLFTLIVFITLICIPLVEEILFRGFLQNFLLSKLPRVWALLLTALIFTLAHFNLHQGLGNVEILLSLFVLSLFLSYVYEKKGSLLACLALHQIFNTISFIGLLYL